MAKINACADAQERNIAQALTAVGSGSSPMPGNNWAVQQGQTRMRSVASKINRELEIKFREQEAFRKEKPPIDTGFVAFLRSFGESWLTFMSGPLTVPFAIVAFFVPGLYRLLFGVLAVASGVFSSYLVWRNERRRGHGQEPVT